MTTRIRHRLTQIMLFAVVAGLVAAAAEPAPPPKTKGPAGVGGRVSFVGEPTNRIVYKTVGDRKLELHVFNPAGLKPSDRRACYVIIHGGGWTANTTERFYPFATHFAKLGCVGIHGYLLPARGMDVFNEAMAQTEAFLISAKLLDHAAKPDVR
jgi:acetyl esterase/lipase